MNSKQHGENYATMLCRAPPPSCRAPPDPNSSAIVTKVYSACRTPLPSLLCAASYMLCCVVIVVSCSSACPNSSAIVVESCSSGSPLLRMSQLLRQTYMCAGVASGKGVPLTLDADATPSSGRRCASLAIWFATESVMLRRDPAGGDLERSCLRR